MNIFDLKQQGLSCREIARETGHSRNTVRKYLRDGASTQARKAKPQRVSKLDPYKDEVNRLVSDGLLSVPAIMSRIVPLGYNAKESILRTYVRSIRPHTKPKQVAIRRYETEPGKQSQFDWGIFSYIDSRGTKRHIPGLYVTLGRSRRSYLEFALSADTYGLITCLINAFFYFGGLTDVFLTDHMKTVVIGGNEKDGWEFNSQMADLANFLGISIKLCRVRRPETKGKVERGIRYAKENFWPGRTFSDLADLNQQALIWCSAADNRIHQSLGITPNEAFIAEQPHLGPLPMRETLYGFEKRIRKVTADSFVSFAGVKYAVPWKYSFSQVEVLPKERTVEIYSNGELIASHPLSYQKRSLVYLPHQYKGIESEAGRLAPPVTVRQIIDTSVEIRSLDEYVEAASARS